MLRVGERQAACAGPKVGLVERGPVAVVFLGHFVAEGLLEDGCLGAGLWVGVGIGSSAVEVDVDVAARDGGPRINGG